MTEVLQQKTIEWADPKESAMQALALSGLDFLSKIGSGEIPSAPISAHMNMRFVSAEVGKVTFAAIPDESHYNPIGSVHGGFYATLLDSACGCAVQTTLPAGQAYTSLDLNVSFLRQITADTGEVTVRGWVTKPGSKAAFAQAEITDANGKLLATATSSCAVFPVGG